MRQILNPGAVLIEGAKEFLLLQPHGAAMSRKRRRDYTAVHIIPGIGIATLQPPFYRASLGYQVKSPPSSRGVSPSTPPRSADVVFLCGGHDATCARPMISSGELKGGLKRGPVPPAPGPFPSGTLQFSGRDHRARTCCGFRRRGCKSSRCRGTRWRRTE